MATEIKTYKKNGNTNQKKGNYYGNKGGNNHNTTPNYKKQLNNIKIKLQSTKYVKTFETFSDGLHAIVNSSQYITDLLNNNAPAVAEGLNEEQFISQTILNIMSNYLPDATIRNNMLWEYHVSGNKVSVKTNNYLAFGWYVKSTKLQDGSFNTKYIFNITIIGNNEELKNILLDNGWNKEERETK